MKITRATYFSLFFLLSFLASLGARNYKRIHVGTSRFELQHQFKLSFSKQENSIASDFEIVFEESESETESDFEAQTFILPFFIALYHSFDRTPILYPIEITVLKPSRDIYISNCNFRI